MALLSHALDTLQFTHLVFEFTETLKPSHWHVHVYLIKPSKHRLSIVSLGEGEVGGEYEAIAYEMRQLPQTDGMSVKVPMLQGRPLKQQESPGATNIVFGVTVRSGPTFGNKIC